MPTPNESVDQAHREAATSRTQRIKVAFSALIAAQAAHSLEEYVGRLWESFPPARFVAGIVSADRQFGFAIANIALVSFGLWCVLVPVRRRWPSALGFVWFWTVVELVNGVGHPAWSVSQGRYTPGVLTAPILLVLALYLARLLRTQSGPAPTAA